MGESWKRERERKERGKGRKEGRRKERKEEKEEGKAACPAQDQDVTALSGTELRDQQRMHVVGSAISPKTDSVRKLKQA